MSLIPTVAAISKIITVPPAPATGAVDNLVVFDNHRYNKFPQPDSFADGELITAFASSTTHTENGWLMIGRSRTGGATWTTTRATINGVQPTTVCTNLSVDENDRVWLFYQDDEVYDQCKAAYSDDRGATWIYIGQHVWTEASPGPPSTPGVVYCQFGTGRPTILPDGDGLITYYAYPFTTTDVATIGTIRFTTSGLTQGPIIRTTTGGTFPNDGTNETMLLITHLGTTNATTKLVALGRRNVGQQWYHHKSADGGETWTTDTTNLAGYPFGNPANVPIAGVVYNDLVYLVIGTRNFPGGLFNCEVCYLSVSRDDFYNNVVAGYSAQTVLYNDVLSETYGNDVDWGYVDIAVQKTFNKLFVQWYGSGPDSPSNSTGYRWLAIKQLVIDV